MNMEELTLVMNTITNLGAEGKTAFIWWLLASEVLPVAAWLTTLLLLFIPARWMYLFFGAAAYLRHLRDRLGIGGPGHLTPYELQELTHALDEILKGMNK